MPDCAIPVFLKMRLRESHRVLPDGRVRVLERVAATNSVRTACQCAPSVQSACIRARPFFDSRTSFSSGSFACRVVLPDQHHHRHVALPAVRAVERRDEPGGVELVEPRPRRGRLVRGAHAVDAAQARAGADVDLRQVRRRNPARVLDHEAVHVHDPQRAVRPGRRLHRAEPVVGRREELAARFVRRRARRRTSSPSASACSRVTSRFTGSQVKALPVNSWPSRSSR